MNSAVLVDGISTIFIFRVPQLHLGRDRHMRSGTFLYEILFPTTFILSFFLWDAYFRQHFVLSRMNSAVLIDCISTIFIFRASQLRLGEDRRMSSGTFFIRNSIPYNFYLKLFLMGCVFLASAFYVHISTYINRGYVDCNDVTIRCPLQIGHTCVSNHLDDEPQLI